MFPSLSHNVKKMVTTLFLFCALLRISTGAAIQKPNTTHLREGSARQCISSADWLGHELVAEDCSAATHKFYNTEVLGRRTRRYYEFLGIGAEPYYHLPNMKTPRRYTVGRTLMRSFRAIQQF